MPTVDSKTPNGRFTQQPLVGCAKSTAMMYSGTSTFP